MTSDFWAAFGVSLSEVCQSSTDTWTSDPAAGGSITRFIYSGWSLLARYVWNSSTSTFDLDQSYLWGLDLSGTSSGAGGAGGLLAEIQGSGSVDLAAYDASGNLTALVDSSSEDSKRGQAVHLPLDRFHLGTNRPGAGVAKDDMGRTSGARGARLSVL